MNVRCQFYCHVLIKEQGSIKVWSCLWRWIIEGTKGDLWGPQKKSRCCSSGRKTISKELGLHKSTVRQIVEENQDHCYPPLEWSANKDHSKARCVIVHEVAKNPQVTSKQLKAFFTLASVNVHESSGEHWTSMACIAELQGESHCSKNNIAVPLQFAKDHVDKPEDYCLAASGPG